MADNDDKEKKAEEKPLEETPSSVGGAAEGQQKKKKKKKKKKAAANAGEVDNSDTKLVASSGNELAQQLAKLKVKPSHAFWDTQPVPKISESLEGVNEWIHPPLPDEEIRKEPYPLLEAFHWEDCNIDDDTIMTEIYTLLNENYVEDDDNMFRFDYSKEFLRWALKPPGFLRQWHVGVRVKATKKLVAFISAIPATLQVYDKPVRLVEINFLCVHKKLRSKRLAPVLIKEITRRVHVTGLFQAVYTAGVVLPKPVASCRYWHRSLNPKKLIDVGFSHLAPRMTMVRTLKLYALEKQPLTPGFREMRKADVPQVHKLLTEYLKNYNMAPVFEEDEVEHWLSPQKNIVNSYVVEDPATKKITDLVSFYTLPSSILGHPTYKNLKAAYSFYNVSRKTPLVDLMNDALIAAKAAEFDVFNALDIFENETFFKPLKFGVGDGHLQYYLFNWKCPTMSPKKLGLVLL